METRSLVGEGDLDVEATVGPAKKYFRDQAVNRGIHQRWLSDHSEICEEWRGGLVCQLRYMNDIGFIRQCKRLPQANTLRRN